MKILAVMKNWLGDLLFQMPALDLIKERYPAAEIFCMAPERCREILEAHPAVSGFIPFDEKSTHRSWLKRLFAIFELQTQGPWAEGYLFHRSKSRAMLLWLAGVPKRIGYQKGRRMFLTSRVQEPERKLHQLDYFMNLMKEAGYPVPQEPRYRFYFTAEDEKKALSALNENRIQENERYFAFHLGANWEPKRWPTERFAELADKIQEKWGIPVLVTGAKADRALVEELKNNIHEARIIDLVGKTSLRVSAVIFQKSACLITSDSGPMHMASGVGARVVAIFGPTDPDLTGPRGIGEDIVLQYVPPGYAIPFMGKDLPEDGWLEKISSDEVLEAIEKICPK